jgi:predicted site-specific integrase-resolvase
LISAPLVHSTSRESTVTRVALYPRVSTKDGKQDADNQCLQLCQFCRMLRNASDTAAKVDVRVILPAPVSGW